MTYSELGEAVAKKVNYDPKKYNFQDIVYELGGLFHIVDLEEMGRIKCDVDVTGPRHWHAYSMRHHYFADRYNMALDIGAYCIMSECGAKPGKYNIKDNRSSVQSFALGFLMNREKFIEICEEWEIDNHERLEKSDCHLCVHFNVNSHWVLARYNQIEKLYGKR